MTMLDEHVIRLLIYCEGLHMGDTSVLTVTADNEIVMGGVNASAMLLPSFDCDHRQRDCHGWGQNVGNAIARFGCALGIPE